MPIRTVSERPTAVGWVTARLDELFFSRGSAAELGWLRILFYGMVLTLSFSFQSNFPLWASVSREFWNPTFFYSLVPIPVLPAAGLLTVLWVWRVALLCSAIGYGGSLPRAVAAVLGFYVIGLPHNFGKVNHNDAIVMITLVIFAVGRVNAAWSVDSLRRVARSARTGVPVEMLSVAEASWPIRVAQLMVALVLWAASIAKLRDAGLAWVFSDNIYNTIIRHHYTHQPFTDLGLVFVRYPIVCQLLAAISLTLEFLAPAMVFLRGWWRTALLTAVLGMMLGFGFTLGVLFLHLVLMLFIAFAPWPALGAVLARTMRLPRFVVVFDGSCGLCRRTMAVLRALDVFERLEIHDAVAEWNVLHRRFPRLSQDACLHDMHVLIGDNGTTTVGYDGYRALAAVLPLAWIVLPLLYIPGARWIGNRIYRRVAARRHDDGCPLPVPVQPHTQNS